MKLEDIAKAVGGVLKGSGDIEISGISSPANPKKGSIVFCSSEKDVEKAVKGKPGALVVSSELDFPNYVLVEDVKLALARFLESFYPEEHPQGISENSYVSPSAQLGKNVYVAPYVFIGDNVVLEDNVKIYPFSYIGKNSFLGEDSVVFSGVHIYPNTVIGKRVRIHSGAVIGGDGFGYYIGKEGIKKLNHIGNVIIEDDVEVGANSTIDRALIDSTRVGRFTKIDNLVMVAHNCNIGESNVIVSQVGISGSVKTGKNVILAGQVGVADHVEIGDNVTVTAKAGVSKSLRSGKVYGGVIPAMEWRKWMRIYSLLVKLPEIIKRLK